MRTSDLRFVDTLQHVVFCAAFVATHASLYAQSVEADEIHWTITGSTSVTFDWRGNETLIHYGLKVPYEAVATAQPASPKPISSEGPFQEVTLARLRPNKVYHYSIGRGPDHTFRTPPVRGTAEFTITAEGDIGSSLHHPGVVPVQQRIASHLPRFVLALGDLTYGHPQGQADVDQHFNDVMVWSQDAAYMPVWGNHEWEVAAEDDLRNYKGRFRFPNPQTSASAPQPGCCGEDWYWFDYGNTRFIAYPEGYTPATYGEWYIAAQKLMNEAEVDPKVEFIVTFGHDAPFTSGYHASNLLLREVIGKLGRSHRKYVLNINGHSHDYERSEAVDGVVSVTVGTCGAPLEQNKTACLFRECPKPAWSAVRAMHWGTLELHFGAHAIDASIVCGPAGGGKNDVTCEPGSVIDHFSLERRKR